MESMLSDLVAMLALERIEENIFRGRSQDLGWGRLFGGQVLGQALSAAQQTVPSERSVHSLHAYFLRSGAVDKPVVYSVDCIRDGRSFTTRRVVAIQDGRAIFNLSASYQVAESGLSHQREQMPDAPDPDGLRSEQALARRYFARLPPAAVQAIPTALRERAPSRSAPSIPSIRCTRRSGHRAARSGSAPTARCPTTTRSTSACSPTPRTSTSW